MNAIFDARIAMEKKDVPTDNLYAVFGPEDYYAITMSSRAINTDFNGGNGSNGTIAQAKPEGCRHPAVQQQPRHSAATPGSWYNAEYPKISPRTRALCSTVTAAASDPAESCTAGNFR